MPNVLGQQVVIGKGRIYFAPEDVDAGVEDEVYLGLTDDLTVNVETEQIEVESAEGGLNEVVLNIPTKVTRSATVAIKNMGEDPLSWFVIGTTELFTQAAATDIAYAITDVQTGHWYQLGIAGSQYSGARKVANVTVTTFVEDTDFTVDYDRGRIYIMTAAEGGSIADGADITGDYDTVAATWNRVLANGTQAVRGALRFEAINANGPNRDAYMPFTRLVPSGALTLKNIGNDPIIMNFNLTIDKPEDGVTPPIIFDNISSIATS